jgi:hypothetical protein
VLTIRHDSRQIPLAARHHTFPHRGFLHWRFAYAGPGVRRATVMGPASANLHRSCHSMNAHFANRRALTLFWRYYAVLYEHCHRACVAHAKAELRIRQRLRLFGFGSQSRLFPSVLTRATKDRARSQEIVGRRARSSNLVAGERYNAIPTIAEALFSYRRAPVTRA